MIIRDLRADYIDGGISTAAEISWEDNDFPAATLYFESRAERHQAAAPSPEAFLAACFPLATAHGEVRVRIEAPACPMLVDGLLTAHALWVNWGGVAPMPPQIEAPSRGRSRGSSQRKIGVVCLSGGVDGLYTLMRNHEIYRRSDPAYVRAALFVHGFDIGKRAREPEEDRSNIAQQLITSLCADAGIELILCRTNLRHLPEKAGFWTYRQNGAALAAAAHAAVSAPAYLYIASTYRLADMVPMGSHPSLDSHYSSQRITVLHDGSRFSRLEKIRRLTRWPAAIASLRVCPGTTAPQVNCRRCEKCLRTRLELLLAGIAETPTLGPSLTPIEQWEAIPPTIGHRSFMYEELLEPLRASAHHDLCRVLEARIAAYKSWSEKAEPWPTHRATAAHNL